MYRRKDAFYTRAKAAGYRSRAAFKLLQLVQRHQLIRRGDVVVDLGAWPGGWLQVAAAAVGPSGKVIGMDLQTIAPLPQPWVTVLTGDISDPPTQERLVLACGGAADVLLSDLAPKLSGVRARDQAQAAALVQHVLQVVPRIVRPGGTLIVKLFDGDDLTTTVAQLRTMFRDVRLTRPEATRKGSAEVYALATGFNASSPI